MKNWRMHSQLNPQYHRQQFLANIMKTKHSNLLKSMMRNQKLDKFQVNHLTKELYNKEFFTKNLRTQRALSIFNQQNEDKNSNFIRPPLLKSIHSRLVIMKRKNNIWSVSEWPFNWQILCHNWWFDII